MGVETGNSSGNQGNTSCSKYQGLIDDIGGKAASIVVQQEAGNEDLVIPPQVIKVDDIESGNFEVPSDDRNKKIVRGSASGDERGLVDMIQTLKNISPGDISAGIHKKKDISSLDLTKGNPLAMVMYMNKLGLPEIAEGLGVEVSHDAVRALFERRHLGEYHSSGEIDPEWAGPLIEEYIKDTEIGYASPFFMSQPPLGIQFKDEDIRQLEYGSTSDNPLLKVIQASRRDSVVEHAKKWDGLKDYSGASSVIVQDMVNGRISESPDENMNRRGSIIEHPNIEGHYLINVVIEEGRGKGGISQYLVNSSGEIVAAEHPERALTKDEVHAVVNAILRMKTRTREVGFIDESFSSQAEFGFQSGDVKFFQERRFLPFDYNSSSAPDNYSFNRFGNPEKLGKLRVINLADIGLDTNMFQDGVPSVYIPSFDMIARGTTPNFFPNNMSAMLIGKELKFGEREGEKAGEIRGTAGGNSLEHNTYRYALKAGAIVMGGQIAGVHNMRTGSMIQL